MRSVPSRPFVGPFAERLLDLDLPDLPTDRRSAAISFAIRRIDGLPSVMHLGVLIIAILFRALIVLPGRDAIVRFFAAHPLPLLGEYVRLIRSLGYAYVWEHWPDTSPTGAPS